MHTLLYKDNNKIYQFITSLRYIVSFLRYRYIFVYEVHAILPSEQKWQNLGQLVCDHPAYWVHTLAPYSEHCTLSEHDTGSSTCTVGSVVVSVQYWKRNNRFESLVKWELKNLLTLAQNERHVKSAAKLVNILY